MKISSTNIQYNNHTTYVKHDSKRIYWLPLWLTHSYSYIHAGRILFSTMLLSLYYLSIIYPQNYITNIKFYRHKAPILYVIIFEYYNLVISKKKDNTIAIYSYASAWIRKNTTENDCKRYCKNNNNNLCVGASMFISPTLRGNVTRLYTYEIYCITIVYCYS